METKRYYTQSEVDYLTPDEEAEWAAMVLIGMIEEIGPGVDLITEYRKGLPKWEVKSRGWVFGCRQNALYYIQTHRVRYYRSNERQWEDGEFQPV